MIEPRASRALATLVDRTEPVVKICGLTRLEDVVAARELGVWAVGFVFAASPRQVTPVMARELVERAGLGKGRETGAAKLGGSGSPGTAREHWYRPLSVGVFVDSEVEEIASVVRQVGLDGVQLHGRAGASGNEVRTALMDQGRSPLVIGAVAVDSEGADPGDLREAARKVAREADVVLLDTSVRQPLNGVDRNSQPLSGGERVRFGGTGKTFPWRLAREVGEGRPLLVAGGIDPQNAQAALAESGAWGIDVSSGVESSPGVKEAGLMEELVASVKGGGVT